MVTTQCVGRRRLEWHLQADGSYKVDIKIGTTRLATLIIDKAEAAKLRARMIKHSK